MGTPALVERVFLPVRMFFFFVVRGWSFEGVCSSSSAYTVLPPVTGWRL